MLIADLIHSCSNDKVAQAALACIGGRFADRVRATAHEKGVGVGRFVALVIRDYARRADDAEHQALQAKVAGDDQPLLKGLRVVLESVLETDAVFLDDAEIDAPFIFGGAALELRYQ